MLNVPCPDPGEKAQANDRDTISGLAALNTYLAVESVRDLARRGVLDGVSEKKAEANLLKALGKGLLKIMS